MKNVSSSNGNEKYPKLRFPEFRDEWTALPFEQLIDEFNDRTKEENEDTLLSAAIEGMFLNSELFDHQRGASNKGYKKIKKGTMVLSTQNLHLGNANVNQRFEHGMVSPAYKTYAIKNCSIDLMAQWIKSEKAKKFFFNATTVGASVCRRNVEWETLYNQKIYLPSMEEQNKIAHFLKMLTLKIEKQSNYVALLKKYKRGLIHQIFNRKIAFHENTGSCFPKWEECQLSDIASFHQGLTYSPNNVSENGTLVLRSSNIQDSRLDLSDTVYVNLSISENMQIQKNDILMCVRNGSKKLVGKTAIIRNNIPNTTWGAFMMIIRSKVSNSFVYHYLNSELFYNQVFKDSGTATINQITKGLLNECKIKVPTIHEQQQICNILDKIDEKIFIENRLLNSLVEEKNSMLQQLFI